VVSSRIISADFDIMTLPGSIIPGGLNRKLRQPPLPPRQKPFNQIKNNVALVPFGWGLKSIINHEHEGEIYLFVSWCLVSGIYSVFTYNNYNIKKYLPTQYGREPGHLFI